MSVGGGRKPLLNSMTLDKSFRLAAGASSICKIELRQPAPPSSQNSSENPVCTNVLCRLYGVIIIASVGVIIIASVRYISRRYLENWCERAASFLFLAHLPPSCRCGLSDPHPQLLSALKYASVLLPLSDLKPLVHFVSFHFVYS